VTAVDVSPTVLRKASDLAIEEGVGGRIDWQAHDLSRSFPAGRFDLVSAQFLHSPVAVAGEREGILARAVRAVAQGGVLLIASHAGWPSWMDEPPFEYHFPTNEQILDALALEPGRWLVEVDEVHTREMTGAEGENGSRDDNLLRIRCLG
jgi:SAM-dependent methyltransferase